MEQLSFDPALNLVTGSAELGQKVLVSVHDLEGQMVLAFATVAGLASGAFSIRLERLEPGKYELRWAQVCLAITVIK